MVGTRGNIDSGPHVSEVELHYLAAFNLLVKIKA